MITVSYEGIRFTWLELGIFLVIGILVGIIIGSNQMYNKMFNGGCEQVMREKNVQEKLGIIK